MELWKPFFSLAIVLLFLFAAVFTKVELRQMGYRYYQLSQEERRLQTHLRSQVAEVAELSQPQRLHGLAQEQLTLRQSQHGEIIRLGTSEWALKQ